VDNYFHYDFLAEQLTIFTDSKKNRLKLSSKVFQLCVGVQRPHLGFRFSGWRSFFGTFLCALYLCG